jgi:uncharacterized damage-inducible protein DinB
MLIHLIVHSGYHRGEVGRIMSRLSINMPWDTFAVYLHRTQPSRRLRMGQESTAKPPLEWRRP